MAIAGIPNPGVCAYPPERVRRRYARRVVEAETIGAELGGLAPVRVLDLSEGGARVKSPAPLAFSKGVLVSVSLPGGTAIRADCELVWSDASGAAGLRFLAFSDNGKTRLAQWLSEWPAEAATTSEPPVVVAAPVAPEPELPTEPTPAADPRWRAEADEPGLEELVRKMMLMTAADGAAIALLRDDAVVCCATAGNAPKLGLKLNPDAGLSGRCLRSGEPVLCRDSETDPTVNAEACRALRLRAALLVPVKRDEQVGGVLEVFSSKPDVFDLADVAGLQRLALVAAEYLPPVEATVVATAGSAPEMVAEPAPAAQSASATDAVEAVPEERSAEVTAGLTTLSPKTIFRLVSDPEYKRWKRAAYWSAIAARKTVALATLTVPLSYLMCFLIGPVIRPEALLHSPVFGYMNAVVEPGMALADDFFSFRGVVHGWNLMFLLVGLLALIGRAMVLKPINLVLRKAEDVTRPRKHYAYVPYRPHRTEFH